MTDTSAPPPAPRYRLRTFGTLALVAPGDDTVLGKHGHHRRRLALLAVLAAAGERGRSRDQLLLLFWPDATQARARHSLDQLLYALRSSLGESLFAGGDPVRLNPDVVGSDVGAFNAALERDDLEAAVEAYRGPFLDGVHLGDAPEFEQWLDAERARLERSYAGALERLARGAEAAQDHAAAVRWWRRLAETDPVSSTNATGLIRALMNAGDHAAALQYAERYEAVVAQELGTSVGPAVASLVTEVRAEARTEPVAASKSLPPPPRPSPPAAPVVPPGATPVEQPQAERPPRRRPTAYVIGALVVAVLVATAAGLRATMSDGRPPAAAEPSIAVLPLANQSTDPLDAALADGMTEELIAVLARTAGLRVTASTSVFSFRNRPLDVRSIADSLGVAHLLEGGLQKSGSRLRVRVRLVDARDGSTRWSETYDRELRDVFAVQDDIARAVARELGLRLGAAAGAPLRRLPTRNVAAYELYLRGSDRTLLRSDSAARQGVEYLRQAIALDSTYAAPWAALGRLYNGFGATAPMRDRARYRALAEAAARKALALDDSLAEAHVVLGASRMLVFDFAAAERHLTRATALDPSLALAHQVMVTLRLWTGRPAEALSHAERALALDPLSPTAHAEMARALLGNDRCDEALTRLEKLADLRPPLQRVAPMAAQCYARKGMWPEAITVLRPPAERGGPTALAQLGYMLARAGRREEALRIHATVLERWRRGDGGAFEVALVYAGLGDVAQTVIWLDRSITDRSLVGIPGDPAHFMIMGPLFDDVRRHPGFARVRERLGLQMR